MTNSLLIFVTFITISCYGQGKILFSLPNLNRMYAGYYNVLQIGSTRKSNKIVTVECDMCDSINRHPSDNIKWIIKPKQEGKLTLTVIGKRGEILGSKSFKIFSLPKPEILISNQNAQGVLRSIPEYLSVKYNPSVPVYTSFLIKSWKIRIEQEIFTGKRSQLTDKVKEYIKSVGSGTMIININYLDPYGEKELKEIFEFIIE